MGSTLPAIDTPQFDWALSRLRQAPQPVPPIYQPEVAARAVVRADERPRRREYWVGGSTIGTLLANRVAPGLLDHYLARTGYGAHGRFDDQAKPRAVRVGPAPPLAVAAAAGGWLLTRLARRTS